MSCYYHLIVPKTNDWYLVVGFKQEQKEMVELNFLLLTAGAAVWLEPNKR